MQLLVACVFNNTGIAKESKNPYSIPRCIVLTDFQDVDNTNFQSHGAGFSAVELGVSSNFYAELRNEFDKHFVDIPVSMDLKMALDRDGKNVVTGFIKSKSADVAPVTESGTTTTTTISTPGLFGKQATK